MPADRDAVARARSPRRSRSSRSAPRRRARSESAADPERAGGLRVLEGEGDTRLLIQPGHVWRVVDVLFTNFHLPRSTLLAMVCALGGVDRVLAAYRRAVRERYRFFSYGDAMLAWSRGASRP